MQNKITVSDLIMGVGGLVTFLFSFFAWWSSGGFSVNAWDTDGVAFAATVPAILGLAMVVWIGLGIGGVKLPADVLTFNPAQLKASWGISAAGIMLSWLSVDSPGRGIGFWFMLLGSAAMAAGAVMALLGKGTETVDLPIGSDGDGAAAAAPAAAAPAAESAPAPEAPAPAPEAPAPESGDGA